MIEAALTRSISRKTILRKTLGVSAYRVLTQSPRLIRFILNPKYEPEVPFLRQYVKEGMTCFDIGANYGFYARALSPLVGETGRVISFEPSSITCKFLKTVRRILGWRNVSIQHCALADKPGELELSIPVKKHGGLGIALAHLGPHQSGEEAIREIVAVKTLDDFMEEQNLTACDFIKCDVEGAEMLVLMGAEKTIAQYRPAMMIEVVEAFLARMGHSIAQMNAWLNARNYAIYVLKDGALAKVDGLVDMNNNFLVPES